MCPRPYRLGRREAAGRRIRSRVLAAARRILTSSAGPAAFSIDGVAHEAGVSRMTVYYRFGSRRGLLEALFDDLAARGHIEELPQAFAQPDPLRALAEFIEIFAGFWASGGVLIRRLQAMGEIDPELGEALRARQERRRHGLIVIVGRIAQRRNLPSPLEDIVDIFFTLSSFDTFDTLATKGRAPREVASLLRRLALAVLDTSGA